MRKILLFTAIGLLTSGCVFPAQYYEITDTRTGDKHLAKGILDDISGPGMRFTDDLTGRTIRVEAYKLEHISKESFEDALRSGRAP